MTESRLSPHSLSKIDRARKLLAVAYDKGAARQERENALALAKKVLEGTGITIEELKDQATPEYLKKGFVEAQTGYNPNRATNMANILKRGGWKAEDPGQHGYKDFKGDISDVEKPNKFSSHRGHDPRRFRRT